MSGRWFALMRVKEIRVETLAELPPDKRPERVLIPLWTTLAEDADGSDHAQGDGQYTFPVAHLSEWDLRLDRPTTEEQARSRWASRRASLRFLRGVPDQPGRLTIERCAVLPEVKRAETAEDARLAISAMLTDLGAAHTANGFGWDAIVGGVQALASESTLTLRSQTERALAERDRAWGQAWLDAVGQPLGSTTPAALAARAAIMLTDRDREWGASWGASHERPTPADLASWVATVRRQAGEASEAVARIEHAAAATAKQRDELAAELRSIARALGLTVEGSEAPPTAAMVSRAAELVAGEKADKLLGGSPRAAHANLDAAGVPSMLLEQRVATVIAERDAMRDREREACAILGAAILGAANPHVLSVAQERMTEIRKARALEGELREVLGAGEGERTHDAARRLRQELAELNEEMLRGADPERVGAAVVQLAAEAERATTAQEPATRCPRCSSETAPRPAGGIYCTSEDCSWFEPGPREEPPQEPRPAQDFGPRTSADAATAPVIEDVGRHLAHARHVRHRLRQFVGLHVTDEVLERMIDAVNECTLLGVSALAAERTAERDDRIRAAIERRAWSLDESARDLLFDAILDALPDDGEDSDPFEALDDEDNEPDPDTESVARIEERAAQIIAEMLTGRR